MRGLFYEASGGSDFINCQKAAGMIERQTARVLVSRRLKAKPQVQLNLASFVDCVGDFTEGIGGV